MQNKMKIDDLIQFILDGMVEQKYSQRTIQNYGRRFNVLKRLSKEIGEQYPTLELLSAFLGDTFKTQTGQPSIMTKRQRIRCINLLTSLMKIGNIDWSRRKKEDISALVTETAFQLLLKKFLVQLKQRGLSRSTICSYKRILSYFFIFCQEKGYKELCDIKSNDVSAFIISLYQKGYFKSLFEKPKLRSENIATIHPATSSGAGPQHCSNHSNPRVGGSCRTWTSAPRFGPK